MDQKETLVHECQIEIADVQYGIQVFLKGDGRYLAKTVLAPDDILINDGFSLDEVLTRHRNLLPLALDSRAMRSSIFSSRKS